MESTHSLRQAFWLCISIQTPSGCGLFTPFLPNLHNHSRQTFFSSQFSYFSDAPLCGFTPILKFASETSFCRITCLALDSFSGVYKFMVALAVYYSFTPQFLWYTTTFISSLILVCPSLADIVCLPSLINDQLGLSSDWTVIPQWYVCLSVSAWLRMYDTVDTDPVQ